jgi:hypothetical protein
MENRATPLGAAVQRRYEDLKVAPLAYRMNKQLTRKDAKDAKKKHSNILQQIDNRVAPQTESTKEG